MAKLPRLPKIVIFCVAVAFVLGGIYLYILNNVSKKPSKSPGSVTSQSELSILKPDESGKVLVIAFRGFSDLANLAGNDLRAILESSSYSGFKQLLSTLYSNKYRPISLSDYVNNNISIAPGCIPVIFTFDGGYSSQFNLVKSSNGSLIASSNCAVGIMEEFHNLHSDFALTGTFFISLGTENIFNGLGTIQERLKYLIDKGFDIGNGTLTCPTLDENISPLQFQQEIAKNQQVLSSLLPEYTMASLALPSGKLPTNLTKYLASGHWGSVVYSNTAVLEQGWDPAFSPIDTNFNPLSIHRIKAFNTSSSTSDSSSNLDSWLRKLTRDQLFISDGDPNTITVPQAKKDSIDLLRIGNKTLRVY